jgi:translation elongation factor EF-4
MYVYMCTFINVNTNIFDITYPPAILVMTGNINEKDRKKGQVLDTLKVERERGRQLCIYSIYMYT